MDVKYPTLLMEHVKGEELQIFARVRAETMSLETKIHLLKNICLSMGFLS